MNKRERIVIIGAGVAGTACAAALRSYGYPGRITLLEAEASPEVPYDRPPLTKQVLHGGTATDLGQDFDLTFDSDTELVKGAHALALDIAADSVTVTYSTGGSSDGSQAQKQTLIANQAVLAFGVKPYVPPGWSRAAFVHDLASARLLAEKLAEQDRIAVLGGGWIAAEVAGAAARAGCETTLITRGPGPLHGSLGTAAEFIEAWLESTGVTVQTESHITSVNRNSVEITTAHGTQKRFTADHVVAAAGTAPELDWLHASGLTADRGVHVDGLFRTIGGKRRVWAVGDCAAIINVDGSTLRGPGHWDFALQSAQLAARSIVDPEVETLPYPVPYAFSTLCGREVALVGQAPETATLVARGAPGTGAGSIGYFDDEYLIGLFSVDQPRDATAIRKALAKAPGRSLKVEPEAFADAAVPLKRILQR